MRSTLICILLLIFSWSAFSQNPTPFPNGFRLGTGVEENTTTDSIRIVTINENGISKVIAKDSLVTWLDIPVPEQYFKSITEGSNTGYVHKYRADNPANYGNIGSNAVDLSFSTSSGTRGATGFNSFAAGRNTTASHDQTVAMGDGSQATGIRSVAIGSQNIASGSSSVAIGSSNTASGGYAVALGRSNVASVENATAMGYGNTASGQISIAMGRGNTANSYYSTFIGGWGTVFTGQNAVNRVATDILFNIGNGTDNNSRSNALSLFKNGRLELPSYGDGTFTGTATKLLAVDADGKVIEEDLPSGWTLTITDNDEVSVTEVDTINFTNATVTDNEDGSVDVTVPVGITVVDDDNTETYNNIEALIFEGVTITDNEDGSVTIPISGGEPGGSTGQFQWNNGSVFAGLSNLTTDGTNITIGGTPVLPSTITMGSNSFIRSGAHNLTLTTTGTSNITFPSGTNTVATLGSAQSFTGINSFTNLSYFSNTINTTHPIISTSTSRFGADSNNRVYIGGQQFAETVSVGGNTSVITPFSLKYDTAIGLGIANRGFASILINTSNVTEANTTHPLVSSLIVRPLNINNHASGTTNLSATVWIEGESTGTASPLESYSLYIASGKTRVSDEGITFSDTGVINKVKVTIAAADLRDCSTTPITLIPAQGVNTTIDLINIVGYIDYDSVVYNFSDNLTINQNGYEYYNIDKTIINNSTAAFFKASYEVNGFIASFSDSNIPIQLTSSSDATQGDSDITLIITYTVNQF